jgi:hypothetical protein
MVKAAGVVLVVPFMLVASCKQEATGGAPAPSAGPAVNLSSELLAVSTGLAKPPRVNPDCPDVLGGLKTRKPPVPPAVARGLNGADALTAEDLAFLDTARACREGEPCVNVDEPCNCGFALGARHADRFVADVRGRISCDAQPCCLWGGPAAAGTCREGRCVFIDPGAEAAKAAVGAGAPSPCPDKEAERAKAKADREVAGMSGLRGGAGLSASDVIVLKNSAACEEGDTCVRVEEPCNCGFTVNGQKEDAVRAVAKRIKCATPACCRWRGKPVCKSGECQDTY